MRIEGNKVTFFQRLQKQSQTGRDEAFEKLAKHLEQYKGSQKLDGSDTDATLVRNITYELIESQVNTTLPQPKVDAKVWSERNGRNAKRIERLCSMLRNDLPFERLNDQDERNTYIYGGSVWLIEWDDSIRTQNTVGGIRITCITPENLFPQPGVYDIEDMDWVILRFQSTREEIMDKYGVSIKVAEEAESEEPSHANDTCTVYVCFYKGEHDEVCRYVWSGDQELSDDRDFFARRRYVCRRCGKNRELCKSDEKCDCGASFMAVNEEFEELTHDIVLADGYTIPAASPAWKDGAPVMEKIPRIRTDASGAPMMQLVDGVNVPLTEEVEEQGMEPTRIRWYKPKHFPVVIRKNTSQEDSVLGQSDCAFIRPLQQEVNKVESRIHEKIMSSGVVLYKPEDVDFQYSDEIHARVLDIPPGHTRAEFGVLDMLPNLQQEQQQSERLYENAKRTLGITASYQGQADTTAKSGVAKQAQIQQAAGRLDSKRVMKHAAYADIDRVMFEYYLAYSDEPRPIAYRDAFGRMQGETFNRYDFVSYDELSHEWYYNDQFLFSVDLNGAVEQQREVMWELNMKNFQAGVYGNPADPATLLRYWQMQERVHYPYARENVEYFTAMLESQKAQMAQANQMTEGM